MEPGSWLNTTHFGRSYYLAASTGLDQTCRHFGRLTAPGRLSLELGAVWYSAKGGSPNFCVRTQRLSYHYYLAASMGLN